jgi:hypothetical protein
VLATRRISGGDNRQVNVLRQVMSDPVEAVDPGSAHRAGIRLLLSEHEVVDHERTIRRRKQFAQTHSSDRFITFVEKRWAFQELVILNRCTLWQCAPKLCDSFTLLH